MSRKVDLCLECGDYVVRVPFPSLELADKFTMNYSCHSDMLYVLVEILDLNYGWDSYDKVCLRYSGQDDKWMPIRYSGDNYDVESLDEGYALYLQQDQRRLEGYGIKNVVYRVVPDFVPGKLSDKYIKMLASRYLDNNYKKRRDAYFLIRKHVPIKINKMNDKPLNEEMVPLSNLDRLRQLDNIADPYIQYLVELSCRGEEEYQQAVEELAMMGLDAVEKELGRLDFSVIDGVSSSIYDKGIMYLEECSNKSIENLKDIINGNKVCRRKR